MGFCRRQSSSDASGSKSSASKKSVRHSSSSGEGSSSARSKSRSKSKDRSGGSSSSNSRSSSRSKSRSPSPRRPSRSPTKSITSPGPGGGDKSDTIKSGKSDASYRSNGSVKTKKLLKASERKASAKMEKRMSNDESDSEEESNVVKENIKVERVSKKKIDEASEPTWRDEFDDGLDDELRGNEEDKKRLAIMTEKEREEEIFKRAEKREELKKRFEISQKLKLQLKEDPKFKQKSEGELSSDENKQMLEQTGRKKGYEVKHASKFSALNQLKAKREEKVKKDRERKSKEEKNGKNKREDSGSDSDDMRRLAKPGSNKRFKASETYTSSSDSGNGERRKSSSSSSSSSSASSSGSSGESDTERHKSKKVVKKAINVTCKEDLEKIRLSRFKIDKFVHLPIFKRTVVGCFVRVSIGNNPEKNLPIYRVAEITDVCETAKVYDVMKSRTNIGLRLNHGKMSKVFRAQFISNQPFTDSEFSKWKQTCLAEHVDLPTVKHVEEKFKGIQTALTYRFSSHDVDKILASKEKFAKGPKNYAMAKAKMMKDKVNAQIVGNTELVEEIDCKLAELEEKAEMLDKVRTGSLSNISFINNRNRKDNVERAERGIREEQKRLKMEGKVDDPFTRRKTRPVLSMPKKDDSREMTSELLFELENERKAKEEEKIVSVKVEKENPDIEKQKEITKGSDIFNAHDFDIDIKIGGSESGLVLNSIAVKPLTTSQSSSASSASNKRSLKLEDYKRRRGII